MVEPLARVPLSGLLLGSRVIAVLRADNSEHLVDVARVLVGEGIVSIEVTMNTPGALARVRELRDGVGDAIEIGVGTVLTPQDVDQALAAGADYVVTPNVSSVVIERVRYAGIPVIPGALTPTEVSTAWDLGASAVKLFPAAVVGPTYVAHLRGPFPDVSVIPSGGVGPDTAAGWIAAGSPAVSVGGPLLGDALVGGDLGALRRRAATLVDSLPSPHEAASR